MSSIKVAATIGTPAAKLGEMKPFYKPFNCFVNAYMNQQGIYKDRNLRVVVGSLGLNDHYEFGGKDWTWNDFKAHSSNACWDAHVWLEDNQGRIYDYIFRDYDAIAKQWTGRGLKFVGLVEGGSPERFKQVGVSYVPADKETQEKIWSAMLPHIKLRAQLYGRFEASGGMVLTAAEFVKMLEKAETKEETKEGKEEDDDYGCVVVKTTIPQKKKKTKK